MSITIHFKKYFSKCIWMNVYYIVWHGYMFQSGQYSDGSSCQDCPAGFACPSPSADPQLCVNGTYQVNTGQTSCDPCPAGSSCLDVTQAPEDCGVGFYSALAEGYCQVHIEKVVLSFCFSSHDQQWQENVWSQTLETPAQSSHNLQFHDSCMTLCIIVN